jgi:intracellular septation protein
MTKPAAANENKAPQTTQSATSLWAELGPAVAFILTYTLSGRFFPEGEGLFSKDTAIFWATGALMASTVYVIGYKLFRKEKIPPMLILSGGVVGFFGVLTIALQQEAFAYIKPTLINSLFAIVILGGLAIGQNFWKMMLQHVFDLPDHAWKVLSIRWGLFFIFLAVLNEYLWRTYCPVPETPLVFLGLVIAPSEPYTFMGLQYGAKNAEHIWAWMKIANIFISMVFMLANVPYTMKHWQNDETNPFRSARPD